MFTAPKFNVWRFLEEFKNVKINHLYKNTLYITKTDYISMCTLSINCASGKDRTRSLDLDVFIMFYFREQTLSHGGKLNKDSQAVK